MNLAYQVTRTISQLSDDEVLDLYGRTLMALKVNEAEELRQELKRRMSRQVTLNQQLPWYQNPKF